MVEFKCLEAVLFPFQVPILNRDLTILRDLKEQLSKRTWLMMHLHLLKFIWWTLRLRPHLNCHHQFSLPRIWMVWGTMHVRDGFGVSWSWLFHLSLLFLVPVHPSHQLEEFSLFLSLLTFTLRRSHQFFWGNVLFAGIKLKFLTSVKTFLWDPCLLLHNYLLLLDDYSLSVSVPINLPCHKKLYMRCLL